MRQIVRGRGLANGGDKIARPRLDRGFASTAAAAAAATTIPP